MELSSLIEGAGLAIDAAGVLVIVVGTAISSVRALTSKAWLQGLSVELEGKWPWRAASSSTDAGKAASAG